ncbi:hypothetical protein MRB53_040182 [Persea americana]|nr:hypothetical protein MRB53_040182 [Persea americana]
MPTRRFLYIFATVFTVSLLLLFIPQTQHHQQFRGKLHDIIFKPKVEESEHSFVFKPKYEDPEHNFIFKPKVEEPESNVIFEPKVQEAEDNFVVEPKVEEPEDNFDRLKLYFQDDLVDYTLPTFDDFTHRAAPHNYIGDGHETFATFFASRDSSMLDPYFLAAQQIVYRVLWDPKSKTDRHTMTVFVAPFISQEQRQYFTAAGAIVRELPLRPFTPEHAGAAGRLKDMFSKLEMWNHTEFSKILYLDSDAFPLANVGSAFELAEEQDCKRDLLPDEDLPKEDEICRYTFAGGQDASGVNAGVLVFNPNEAMYERIVRMSLDGSKFDNGLMEQSALHLAYDEEGPFPPSYLPHAYNGAPDTVDNGEPLYIVHSKLWATQYNAEDAWFKHIFNETWNEMLSFYQSSEFKAARLADVTIADGWKNVLHDLRD